MINLVIRVFKWMIAAGVIWAIGLVIFIVTLTDREKALDLIAKSQADSTRQAVAVFTGGGGKRIADAMDLFGRGVGERMLISGVHKDTSRETLKKLWTRSADKFDCCVDLGPYAKSTRGNALELSDWVDKHSFQQVVIVTSDYHLPRAVAETRHRVNHINILAYPVSSSYLSNTGWPQNLRSLKIISVEYTKYLLARISLLADQGQR